MTADEPDMEAQLTRIPEGSFELGWTIVVAVGLLGTVILAGCVGLLGEAHSIVVLSVGVLALLMIACALAARRTQKPGLAWTSATLLALPLIAHVCLGLASSRPMYTFVGFVVLLAPACLWVRAACLWYGTAPKNQKV